MLPQLVNPPLQPSAINPPPLPQLSDFPLQRGVPNIQPLAMRGPPLLFILLQGIGVPSLLPSAVRAYDPLLW